MTNNDLMKIILTRNQARDLSAPIGFNFSCLLLGSLIPLFKGESKIFFKYLIPNLLFLGFWNLYLALTYNKKFILRKLSEGFSVKDIQDGLPSWLVKAASVTSNPSKISIVNIGLSEESNSCNLSGGDTYKWAIFDKIIISDDFATSLQRIEDKILENGSLTGLIGNESSFSLSVDRKNAEINANINIQSEEDFDLDADQVDEIGDFIAAKISDTLLNDTLTKIGFAVDDYSISGNVLINGELIKF
jgi:hypothetical protein